MQVTENSRRQCLCQSIRKQKFRGNGQQMDETLLNLLPNQVAIELDMFCAFMEGGIVSNVHCRVVVTVNGCWRRDRQLKVM